MTTTAPRARLVASARVPRWLVVTTLLLSVAGLGLSAYLTAEHYGGNATLACPASGLVDCLKVTTGPYSQVLGLPVAVYGVGFFAAMTALTLPVAWRAGGSLLHRARLVAAVAAMLAVLYLVYVEIFRAGALCLWCTAVHVVALALGFLVLGFAPRPGEG